MDEIIEKILSSPALSLPPGGCKHLQLMIGNMQAFTFEEYKRIAGIFFKLHPDSPLNQADLLKNIEAFMQEWINIAKLISQHYEKILLVWKRLHDDAIGADYNLPIMINLLPNNAVILKLFARKLEESVPIFSSGKLAYTLIDFCAAAEYKLRSASFKKSNSCPNLYKHVRLVWLESKSSPNLKMYNNAPDRKTSLTNSSATDKYERTAHIVKQDLRQMDLVTKYHSLLAAYKLYAENLDSEIYFKLSTESPDIYAKYSSLKKEDIIQHVIAELRGNKLISDALNTLIEKRICMDDFDYTLHLNDCTVEHVMRLFAAKFINFKGVMEAQPNKFSVSLKSLHSYYMLPAYAVSKALPISTAETLFNTEARQLCAYLDGVVQPAAAASSAAAAAAVSMPTLK